MSQIEQRLQALLHREPAIETCYRAGLINRRALARYLLRRGVAGRTDFDAVVAALRRHDFGDVESPPPDLFADLRVSVKDRILILDYEKDKGLLQRLDRLIGQIDYDRGDTLKIVIGTSSIKLFLDEAKEAALRPLLGRFALRARHASHSEISLLFPEAASTTKGVLAVVLRELALSGVVVTEMLTASPELLLYIPDGHVPGAYDVVRRLNLPPLATASARGSRAAL